MLTIHRPFLDSEHVLTEKRSVKGSRIDRGSVSFFLKGRSDTITNVKSASPYAHASGHSALHPVAWQIYSIYRFDRCDGLFSE